MNVLLARQTSLLINRDYYHSKRSKAYRDELLMKIKNDKKRVLDINLKWCKFKQNTSQEIQSRVYQKIINIRQIVDAIKKGEKQIYIQIMNEVNNQVENS